MSWYLVGQGSILQVFNIVLAAFDPNSSTWILKLGKNVHEEPFWDFTMNYIMFNLCINLGGTDVNIESFHLWAWDRALFTWVLGLSVKLNLSLIGR